MDVLMLALNSKYIHTNLAVRYLKEYSRQRGMENVDFVEYTINHRLPQVVDEIYRRRPAVLLLSCYIWNIEMMKDFAREYKKICPKTVMIAGGPEVSYNSRQVLLENRAIDMVMAGEGEKPLYQLLEYFAGRRALEEVASLTYWKLGEVVSTPWEEEIDLAQLPFAYTDIEQLKNKILYFETIRGCPFRCSYCLSSIDKQVRIRDIRKVKAELQFFLDHRVKQVKFIDRTFNCSHAHTTAVWSYLLEHDNGVTNFHFEITADILRQDETELLNRFRPGLAQLEIGVQTMNPRTLKAIRRTMDTERLESAVAAIHKGENVHLHLDLIAGLPYEDYESFGMSFDRVCRMRPHQLQLGFLKVLKGSEMWERAAEYGIRYLEQPPYEVLCTKWLSYEEVLRLKRIEEMVELYYNSAQFTHTLPVLEKAFHSPFALYETLADFYEKKGYFTASPARAYRYQVLLEFAVAYDGNRKEIYAELLTYDMYLRENLKTRPDFAQDTDQYREEIRAFYQMEEKERRYLPDYKEYDWKQLSRMTHLEPFAYPVWDRSLMAEECESKGRSGGCFLVLFDYRRRDPLTCEATVQTVN